MGAMANTITDAREMSHLYVDENFRRLARMLVEEWGDEAAERAGVLSRGSKHATRLALSVDLLIAEREGRA